MEFLVFVFENTINGMKQRPHKEQKPCKDVFVMRWGRMCEHRKTSTQGIVKHIERRKANGKLLHYEISETQKGKHSKG